MISPTKRQMAILRFIRGYQLAHNGVSPSFELIAEATGRASKSRIGDALFRLEVLGLIRRLPNRARAIEVLHPPAIPRDPQGEPLYWVEVGK